MQQRFFVKHILKLNGVFKGPTTEALYKGPKILAMPLSSAIQRWYCQLLIWFWLTERIENNPNQNRTESELLCKKWQLLKPQMGEIYSVNIPGGLYLVTISNINNYNNNNDRGNDHAIRLTSSNMCWYAHCTLTPLLSGVLLNEIWGWTRTCKRNSQVSKNLRDFSTWGNKNSLVFQSNAFSLQFSD